MKIREIIQTLFPTRTWKLAAIIAGGVLCGLGSYTLHGIIARTAVTPLATIAMCRTRTP